MRIRVCWTLLAAIAAGACGGGGGEVIMLNPGDGLPVESFEGTDVADMNNDGFPDIVSASRWFDGDSLSESRLNVFLQDAANPGTFLSRTYSVHDEGSTIWDVIAEDIDLDGVPEVLIKSISFDGFALFRQDAMNPGQFLPPERFGSDGQFDASFADSFQVGDIDGDLYPDVVLTSKEDVYLVRQDAQSPGSFEPQVRIGTGAGPFVIEDIDNDGFSDLVTFETHPNNDNLDVRDTWRYLRQDPSLPGVFTNQLSEFIDSVGWALGAADLNGDGSTDVVVNSSKGGREFLIVYMQTPFGTFANQPLIATQLDGILGEQAIADLDDDGRPEVVAAMNTGAVNPQLIQIYGQDASGNYVAGAVLQIPDPTVTQPFMHAVHVADIDLDGQPDIVVSTDEVFVFFQRTGSPGVFRSAVRVAAQR